MRLDITIIIPFHVWQSDVPTIVTTVFIQILAVATNRGAFINFGPNPHGANNNNSSTKDWFGRTVLQGMIEK